MRVWFCRGLSAEAAMVSVLRRHGVEPPPWLGALCHEVLDGDAALATAVGSAFLFARPQNPDDGRALLAAHAAANATNDAATRWTPARWRRRLEAARRGVKYVYVRNSAEGPWTFLAVNAAQPRAFPKTGAGYDFGTPTLEALGKRFRPSGGGPFFSFSICGGLDCVDQAEVSAMCAADRRGDLARLLTPALDPLFAQLDLTPPSGLAGAVKAGRAFAGAVEDVDCQFVAPVSRPYETEPDQVVYKLTLSRIGLQSPAAHVR